MKKGAKKKAQEDIDDSIVNPGDCIGHWLDGDQSCEICEIQDSCRDMTQAIEKKENDNGSKK